ncbi:hypothetical protein [Candidatus Enterovibrio altilux]|uniref:hypothetical protein n=1 Tax=Candidatus Enterovibrio altilux TaxID=1927128 RepID=UPI0016804E47|nr:hypothetical protein [Candidatus Enterovibrio luxaltus]
MRILFLYLGNKAGYHQRSLTKIAMVRTNKLLVGTSSLRNYATQISEINGMIKC